MIDASTFLHRYSTWPGNAKAAELVQPTKVNNGRHNSHLDPIDAIFSCQPSYSSLSPTIPSSLSLALYYIVLVNLSNHNDCLIPLLLSFPWFAPCCIIALTRTFAFPRVHLYPSHFQIALYQLSSLLLLLLLLHS